MGYFTNLLPICARIDPSRSFAEAVAHVKSVVFESFANPDIRLEDLVRELSIRTSDGRSLLYQSLFSFQDIRQRVLQWGNVRHERMPLLQPGATEDLGLWFVQEDEGLSGGLVYNVDISHDETAALLHGKYLDLLQAVVEGPARTIDELTTFDFGGRITETRDARTSAPASGVADAVQAQQSSPSPDQSAGEDTFENTLVDIWRDMLGIESISIDDDFFALGGHSLQAVQMFHAASQALSANLPLATLLSAPSVRTLAAAFRKDAGHGALVSDGNGTGTGSADPWSPLVLIRPGKGRPPLFLVHAMGGNILNYWPLAEAMPEGVPVYGLQAVGIDGITPPLTRIEDMAALYISQMRAVQPQGPYYIAGGSTGGMIGYDITRQLSGLGQQVALLGLIDTSSQYGEAWRRIASGELGSRISRILRRMRTSPWRECAKLVGQRLQSLMLGMLARLTRKVGLELPPQCALRATGSEPRARLRGFDCPVPCATAAWCTPRGRVFGLGRFRIRSAGTGDSGRPRRDHRGPGTGPGHARIAQPRPWPRRQGRRNAIHAGRLDSIGVHMSPAKQGIVAHHPAFPINRLAAIPAAREQAGVSGMHNPKPRMPATGLEGSTDVHGR